SWVRIQTSSLEPPEHAAAPERRNLPGALVAAEESLFSFGDLVAGSPERCAEAHVVAAPVTIPSWHGPKQTASKATSGASASWAHGTLTARHSSCSAARS